LKNMGKCCIWIIDNNKNDIILCKINTIEEEKTIITCLEELYSWIHANTQFLVSETLFLST